ncbi:hypothetical protein GCM10020255_081330 [Rhodococcus baikonurensis]
MTRSVPSLALAQSEWTARRALHLEEVEKLVEPHRARRSAGISHPVHDFLFTYYNFKPAQLRRWHPVTESHSRTPVNTQPSPAIASTIRVPRRSTTQCWSVGVTQSNSCGIC